MTFALYDTGGNEGGRTGKYSKGTKWDIKRGKKHGRGRGKDWGGIWWVLFWGSFLVVISVDGLCCVGCYILVAHGQEAPTSVA